jgi:hypothetical protein
MTDNRSNPIDPTDPKWFTGPIVNVDLLDGPARRFALLFNQRLVALTPALTDAVLYFDRHGRCITVGEWVVLIVRPDYRELVRDPVKTPKGNNVEVVTVWEGIERAPGNPIFVTTVYNARSESIAERRWPSELDALEGHDRIVQVMMRHGLPLEAI